jgi:hypothetical protein
VVSRRCDRVHSLSHFAEDQVKITFALVNLTASAGLNAAREVVTYPPQAAGEGNRTSEKTPTLATRH